MCGKEGVAVPLSLIKKTFKGNLETWPTTRNKKATERYKK
jgi:hypothetical protein